MAPCRATLTTGPRITVAPGDGGDAPRREAARKQQRQLTGKVRRLFEPSAALCCAPAQALPAVPEHSRTKTQLRRRMQHSAMHMQL